MKNREDSFIVCFSETGCKAGVGGDVWNDLPLRLRKESLWRGLFDVSKDCESVSSEERSLIRSVKS